MDSTKDGFIEPNLKKEVSNVQLESSEEPNSVVDSNKTESNTEAVSNFNDYSCNFDRNGNIEKIPLPLKKMG